MTYPFSVIVKIGGPMFAVACLRYRLETYMRARGGVLQLSIQLATTAGMAAESCRDPSGATVTFGQDQTVLRARVSPQTHT